MTMNTWKLDKTAFEMKIEAKNILPVSPTFERTE